MSCMFNISCISKVILILCKGPLFRDVVKHLSAHSNHSKIFLDELIKKAARPSDEYDFAPNYKDSSIQDWYDSSQDE